jgi:putative transposase
MPQSFGSILAHIVFSTKNRAPVLSDTIRPELYSYLFTVCEDIKAKAILINGTENHVHILASLPRDMSPSAVVQKLKTATSVWIKNRFPELKEFYWQGGYGYFLVSKSGTELVRKYIAAQEEHHKKMTFEDEFRAILKKHGIEYDERYMWD